MRISTGFDNGAMAVVEERSPGVFDLWPYRAEEYGRHIELEARRPHDRVEGESGGRDAANFAFHFELAGCRGRKVTLRFHVNENKGASGVSVVYANPDFPVWSPDGESWHRMPHKVLQDDPEAPGGSIVVVEQEFAAEPVRIAYQYPYGDSRLTAWLERAGSTGFCTARSCGRSTEGRDVRVVTVTDPSVSGPKRTVWLTGIQHSAETAAGWGIEGVLDFLLSDDPLAASARRACVVNAVPIVNVDSVAEGRGRLHPRNLNLNREWEKPEPAAEAAAIRGEMDRSVARGERIDLFVDIHGFSSLADGRWLLLPLSDDAQPREAVERAARVREYLCRHIPFRVTSGPWPGYAAGMAARRHGAAAFSIDGWLFPWPAAEGSPELSSHYMHGFQVWPLAGLKAAGAALARAMTEALAALPATRT